MTVFAVATAMSLMACSAAATPLYRLYQESLRLPQATVTIIFASYALAVLVSLLTLGLYLGLCRPQAGDPLFAGPQCRGFTDFPPRRIGGELIAARVIQGIAVGAATTTLGATILDTDKPHAPTLNGVTNFAGLAVGALGSGLLVSFAPLPTKLIFLLLLAVTLVELALLFFMPETRLRRRPARHGRWCHGSYCPKRCAGRSSATSSIFSVQTVCHQIRQRPRDEAFDGDAPCFREHLRASCCGVALKSDLRRDEVINKDCGDEGRSTGGHMVRGSPSVTATRAMSSKSRITRATSSDAVPSLAFVKLSSPVSAVGECLELQRGAKMTTDHHRDKDDLKIRIGGWFEASASGRLGIAVVAILWASVLLAKVAHWL